MRLSILQTFKPIRKATDQWIGRKPRETVGTTALKTNLKLTYGNRFTLWSTIGNQLSDKFLATFEFVASVLSAQETNVEL